MSQNRSSAVMQQRKDPHDSLDDFPTPPWGTRALLRELLLSGERMDTMSVHEPTANRGYMVGVLRDHFGEVIATDVHDYGYGYPQLDFLFPNCAVDVDWTICNPPFQLAEEFIIKGLEQSARGVAVLVRTAFLEGIGRHERLFSIHRPRRIYQFTERLPIVKGRVDPEASSATAYCWLVWIKRDDGIDPPPSLHWIAPCRKELEREGDYEVVA